MVVKKILLDTNAYTRYLAGEKKVLHVLGRAEIVYMSVIVLGELFAGFKGGSRNSENKVLLDEFLHKPTVKILSITLETSEVFGQIKNTLKTAGTPLPINDIWIASNAVETGSVVITYDTHFEKIMGMRVWDELP